MEAKKWWTLSMCCLVEGALISCFIFYNTGLDGRCFIFYGMVLCIICCMIAGCREIEEL